MARFRCDRHPQLSVMLADGRVAARFHDGRSAATDEEAVAALRAHPDVLEEAAVTELAAADPDRQGPATARTRQRRRSTA